MVQAGETCEKSHAIASVPTATAAMVRTAFASRPFERAANTAAMPDPAASRSEAVTVPPPSSPSAICNGTPRRGGSSHGAPVCAVW